MVRARGYTLIEMLIVIGVIMLLLATMIAATAHLREIARRNRTKALLEKILNGLEGYKLQFRFYPPDNFAGNTGNKALVYFLTTPFRIVPAASNGEVYSTIDMGPLIKFNQEELISGQLIDAWGRPLHYERIQQEDLAKAQKLDVPVGYDPTKGMAAGERTLIQSYICKLYSWGANRTDDGGAGDDILPSKQ
jgi:type II secretory pathway pseudopilin PulG